MIASTLFAMGLSALAASLPASTVSQARTDLLGMHGEAQRARIERGVDQAASLWRASDGDGAAFVAFAKENFASDPQVLDGLLQRFEENLESLDGHMAEIGRDLSRRTVIEMGPILPVDRLFGAWEPSAHASEDLFAQKIAFVALLNFPLSTFEERLDKGDAWTRRQWAEARLAHRFETRVPADVAQGIAQATADAELYIAEYNVWMHHVVDAKGTRLWPKGLKLLSHWNLRDEIKANYASKDGLAKQRPRWKPAGGRSPRGPRASPTRATSAFSPATARRTRRTRTRPRSRRSSAAGSTWTARFPSHASKRCSPRS
jgi:hypothetical protein